MAIRSVPSRREFNAVLKDGSTLRVRPVRPDDEVKLLQFLRGLSAGSRTQRFFSETTDQFLRESARIESQADFVRRVGLVATTGSPEELVGHAEFVAIDGGRAEVAFTIADAYQGRGLGTILLAELAEIAAAAGIRVFEAYVLPANHLMVGMFRDSGFPTEVRVNAGELIVSFPTALTEEAVEQFLRREQVAVTNAMQAFFRPRSIAVVGASRERGTISGELFHNLLSSGFPGPIYPVNPNAVVVQSVPAFPRVDAIPGPVDLAVITVPAAMVLEAAQQCARKKVRAIVIISSGFAEIGDRGRQLQDELLLICRVSGMRLIGPNCMGIVNTDPASPLNGTFAPSMPPEGRVGFYSQSGALGLAIIDYVATLGLGLSTFVSIGNKADISGNDLLEYWEADPRTDVILMYLESFGNPRKFARIAQRVGKIKPIVVVKSGRSRAGVRATSSHTGALLAASDVTVDALFRQAGVIRTDTLEEMFDVGVLLAHQPPPTGPRVGIITNAGGPGILCADACEAEGLQVLELSEQTRARLKVFLPPQASIGNPVDMIASAPAAHYRDAIKAVAEDPGIDALIAIFIPPLVTHSEDVAGAIVEAVRSMGGDKPVLTVFMSSRGVPDALHTSDVQIPSFAFPEDAAIALARVARYGQWRSTPRATPPTLPDLRRDEAAALVAVALEQGARWLTPAETHTLLSAYGLPLARQKVAATPEAAGSAAREFGVVALKAIAPDLLHKTEAGGVRLGLRSGDEVRAAAEEMQRQLSLSGHSLDGFLVQEMAPKGVDMLIGVVHDEHFGPVIACGAGGVLVELLKDVSVRLPPLNREDAREMIRGLKSAPMLTGYRGQKPVDITALEDALLRVSALVEDLPQIAEMDLNPIIVHPDGAVIVDARIRVAPVTPPSAYGFAR